MCVGGGVLNPPDTSISDREQQLSSAVKAGVSLPQALGGGASEDCRSRVGPSRVRSGGKEQHRPPPSCHPGPPAGVTAAIKRGSPLSRPRAAPLRARGLWPISLGEPPLASLRRTNTPGRQDASEHRSHRKRHGPPATCTSRTTRHTHVTRTSRTTRHTHVTDHTSHARHGPRVTHTSRATYRTPNEARLHPEVGKPWQKMYQLNV